MSMNNQTPPPAPGPLCAIYELQLPLLLLGELDDDETVALRAHLAKCDYCQSMLRKYEILRGALARDFDATVSSLQPATQSSQTSTRGHSGSPVPPALLTLEDIMQATNKPSPVAPTAEHQSPQLHFPPNQKRLTVLGAIAAVLVLTVLAASLFTYFGSRGNAPAAQPTTTPGLDAQSQAYVQVLDTYYTPLEASYYQEQGCVTNEVHRTTPSDKLSALQSCHALETTVAGNAQTLSDHLTLSPPARWRTADAQLKQAAHATNSVFTQGASIASPSAWEAFGVQEEDAMGQFCAPLNQINPDIVAAGVLSEVLELPVAGCGGI